MLNCSRFLGKGGREPVVPQFEISVAPVDSARPFMKSAKNTMLAQNMLAMNGAQGDFPWAFCQSPNPVHEGRFAADQDEPEC
jgi:hypothetical protein